MLCFVGIGINGYRGLSLAALDVLKQCDTIYVERFTSEVSDSDLEGLNSLLEVEVTPVQRWFVEDGREILERSKDRKVALVTYGDPLIATTHSELRTRAQKSSIDTSVLHSASGISSAIGETGLHAYKFGRMVTIMSDRQSAVSTYNTIFENLHAGCHTLILTEYNFDQKKEPFFLDPIQVFKSLSEVEEVERCQIFSDKTFIVVASRVGMPDQQIISGRAKSLLQADFGNGPHSIVVTGPLHFTESDALTALTSSLDDPVDNSQQIKKISTMMLERYSPGAKLAVQRMRDVIRAERSDNGGNKGMYEVLDNAEYYISDAERFLRQGKDELAVLSIGYAEGLVDALRFQKGINPWEKLG